MREALKAIGERDRHTFTAEVVRLGWKHGFKAPLRTLLVKDVKLDGDAPRRVASHLWFTLGRQMERLELKAGDRIRFSARVKEYTKGYKGRRWDVFDKPIETDWCLSFPTQIQKISDASPNGAKQATFF